MPADRVPTGRMVRAARGLLNLDQAELAAMIGVTRRTIVRLEMDQMPAINPRRVEILRAIGDSLERAHSIRFIYPSPSTGEGVALRATRKRRS